MIFANDSAYFEVAKPNTLQTAPIAPNTIASVPTTGGQPLGRVGLEANRAGWQRHVLVVAEVAVGLGVALLAGDDVGVGVGDSEGVHDGVLDRLALHAGLFHRRSDFAADIAV